MKPETLVTEKIIEYCRPLTLIFVLGATKSGKVTIAKELSKQLDDRIILISDDYIRLYGQDGALDMLEQDMNEYYYSGYYIIVEGILGFRLLRRMVKNGYHLPDMVIKTECNKETIQYFYEKEEPGKNLNSVFGFNSGLEKIWIQALETVYSQNRRLNVLKLNTSIF